MPAITSLAEAERFRQNREGLAPWKKWGPYLSERQWGTVREDYSADGNAWDYFPHDQSRSRAYHWGEDGLELGRYDDSYADAAVKFCEHFLWVASAMSRLGENSSGLWNEEDGFFYDVLRFPDGRAMQMKVRSLVGLLSFCATTVIYPDMLDRVPNFKVRIRRFLDRNSYVVANLNPPDPGYKGRYILSTLNKGRLRRILAHMLDENEFLGPHGIRSISRHHKEHPYVFRVDGGEFGVSYQPAESESGLFGGNSNWRGPVWFPINMLILRAMVNFYLYYGDDFKVECPTGSGRHLTLIEVAQELSHRLYSIFLRDAANGGRRPVYGATKKFQEDPHWRDYILFYEYFHGDNGAGIGASHQTGWTGLVARLIRLSVGLDAKRLLDTEYKPTLGKNPGIQAGMAAGKP